MDTQESKAKLHGASATPAHDWTSDKSETTLSIRSPYCTTTYTPSMSRLQPCLQQSGLRRVRARVCAATPSLAARIIFERGGSVPTHTELRDGAPVAGPTWCLLHVN